MNTTNFWLSKTLWVAAGTAILGFIQAIQPMVTDPQIAGWLVTILGGINFLLRLATNTAIKGTPLPDPPKDETDVSG